MCFFIKQLGFFIKQLGHFLVIAALSHKDQNMLWFHRFPNFPHWSIFIPQPAGQSLRFLQLEWSTAESLWVFHRRAWSCAESVSTDLCHDRHCNTSTKATSWGWPNLENALWRLGTARFLTWNLPEFIEFIVCRKDMPRLGFGQLTRWPKWRNWLRNASHMWDSR